MIDVGGGGLAAAGGDRFASVLVVRCTVYFLILFCSMMFMEVSIITAFVAFSQGCTASGCNLRGCGRNEALQRPTGRIRCITPRNAVQPRASDAQGDKTRPNLFGMPLRPAQLDREHGVSPASTQPQQSINGPLDALRAHGTSLKHVAAGIAISAALFAGAQISFLHNKHVTSLQAKTL